jgi:hypothetical protein
MSAQLDAAIIELRAAKAQLDEKAGESSRLESLHRAADEETIQAQARFDSAKFALPDAALIEE